MTGPSFTLAPGIDGALLLEAIAHVETSGGRMNWPRIEAAYIPKGLAIEIQGRVVSGTGVCVNDVVRERWKKWAPDSWVTAASWGPWQILYHTAADLGYAGQPWGLWPADGSRPWVIRRLMKIAARGATTVEQFADAWNSGSFRDRNIPALYIASVVGAYKALDAARTSHSTSQPPPAQQRPA